MPVNILSRQGAGRQTREDMEKKMWNVRNVLQSQSAQDNDEDFQELDFVSARRNVVRHGASAVASRI